MPKLILQFLLTTAIPLIYLLVLFTIYKFPVTFPASLLPTASYLSAPRWQYTFLSITLLGLLLWIVSYWQLRHHFGVLPQKQTFIHTGLYRYLKHPMYYGIFLTFTGLALLTLSFPGLLINLIFLTPINIIRAKNETKLKNN